MTFLLSNCCDYNSSELNCNIVGNSNALADKVAKPDSAPFRSGEFIIGDAVGEVTDQSYLKGWQRIQAANAQDQSAPKVYFGVGDGALLVTLKAVAGSYGSKTIIDDALMKLDQAQKSSVVGCRSCPTEHAIAALLSVQTPGKQSPIDVLGNHNQNGPLIIVELADLDGGVSRLVDIGAMTSSIDRKMAKSCVSRILAAAASPPYSPVEIDKHLWSDGRTTQQLFPSLANVLHEDLVFDGYQDTSRRVIRLGPPFPLPSKPRIRRAIRSRATELYLNSQSNTLFDLLSD